MGGMVSGTGGALDASVGSGGIAGTADAGKVEAGTSKVQQIIRACAKAASCGAQIPPGVDGPFTVSLCINRFGYPGGLSTPVSGVVDPDVAKRLIDCASSATCADYFSCFGGDWLGLSRCREGANCKDNKLTQYDVGSPQFDCSVLGATCFELYSGAIRSCCNAKLCTDSLNTVTCNSTSGTYCHGWGAYFEFECGPNTVCNTDPSALCIGTGAPCSLQDPVTCSGDVASYCAGGKIATLDCGDNPFRSACGSKSYEPCVPRGSQCHPQGFEGNCQGSELSFCFDGEIKTIDCTSLGFKSCGAGVVGGARCVE